MEHNKAPGLDGFPTEFHKDLWHIIKTGLSELFNCLHAGRLDLFRLNFDEIVLLLKIKEAERMQQYRAICLLNASFKIFTKVATNRLNSVDHVIQPSQTTFMQGRNILDGVVILHETVHEMHRENMSAVVFKSTLKKPMIRLNDLSSIRP